LVVVYFDKLVSNHTVGSLSKKNVQVLIQRGVDLMNPLTIT